MPQDNFKQSKETHLNKLYKPDRSKKENVDKRIIPLIDIINSNNNYFTTSSCSGRIMIIKPAEVKHEVSWLFSSHDKVDADKLIKKIHNIVKDVQEILWLKVEGFIIHVACKDIESAHKILEIAKKSGLKRSGIIGLSSKFMVEIISSEIIEIPISKDNKLLITDNYLKFIIEECNSKLDKIYLRIKILEEMLNKKEKKEKII